MNEKQGLAGKRIWVAGHRGMVGAAVVRRLEKTGATVLFAPRDELDLRNASDVHEWTKSQRPDAVIVAAARVGGLADILRSPSDYYLDNVLIQSSIAHACNLTEIDCVIFISSSSCYPSNADIPLSESMFGCGPLDENFEPYAQAKIQTSYLCQYINRQYGRHYTTAVVPNLLGVGDNFDLSKTQVIPTLIRKAHEAKARQSKPMILWGSGKPRREFLYSSDCADALVFLLSNGLSNEIINIGSGDEYSILEAATIICNIVGYECIIELDTTKSDGPYRKVLDTLLIKYLGWRPNTIFEAAIRQSYRWFLDHHADG